MDSYREYFPTKAFRLAEMRLGNLLGAERDRLDQIADKLGRESAVGPDNLLEQLPFILDFTKKYHEAFAAYLKAVLPQQPRPIQCRAACGNCCHHYPMSVEPFELIYLYSELRKRTDLLDIIEACQERSSMFEGFYESRKSEGTVVDDDFDDKAEDLALHDYFAAWKPCPFSNKVGDCTVYPLRPVSCRMYFSETDPKFCTPEHLQTPDNDSYIVYLPDHIEDAVYGISEHYALLDLPESYFGGLLALNGFEGVIGAGDVR
ncbi:MAG: YkgJ family cysteine cluster protein [Fibrobacter sp.]|nr:YkgJ family cysteine cluster protein [Fibrobacter sp.]